jgi:hypothetical protein
MQVKEKNIMKVLSRFVASVIALCLATSALAQNMSLRLTSPAKNDHYAACSDINVSAEATMQTGAVKRVEFYINGTRLKSVTKAPYETVWAAVPDGIYEVYAKGVDDSDAEISTEPIFVYVGNTMPGNVIINGEFTCALFPWFLDNYVNAVSTISLVPDLGLTNDAPGVMVEIQNQGDQPWAIQLMQPFKTKAGHTYEVTFWAQADEAKAITVDVNRNYDDYAALYSNAVTVDQLDLYGPLTFTATTDDDNLMFKFVIGGNTISFYLDAVVVIDKEWSEVQHASPQGATSFNLMQNYPNPFNPQTTIAYELQKSGAVSLAIFNILGEKVTSFDAVEQAGQHSFTWNGTDRSGRQCPSGVYIYRLNTESGALTKKMHLLR